LALAFLHLLERSVYTVFARWRYSSSQ